MKRSSILRILTNKLIVLISIEIAESSEAKNTERNFSSQKLNFLFLMRSFASRFTLR